MIRALQARKIIRRFNNTKILVIGDLILDEFIWGNVNRISPEAPVPVVWADRRSYLPGGAANVASNIVSLGAKSTLAGIAGGDKNKDILIAELKKRNIGTQGIFVDSDRYTTLKTRIIAGHQQVVRVDWENTHSMNKRLNQRLISYIKTRIDKFDAIIFEDYGKGVINRMLLENIIPLARKKKKITTVDPKEEHIKQYLGVTCITPNLKEAELAVRYLKLKDTKNKLGLMSDKLKSLKDIDLSGKQLIKYLDLDSLLITHGEQGMYLFSKATKMKHIPTVAQEVFDVSGAGDTVISTFTLALAAGASYLQAAHLANYAAGIVVGKVGVATVTQKELLQQIK